MAAIPEGERRQVGTVVWAAAGLGTFSSSDKVSEPTLTQQLFLTHHLHQEADRGRVVIEGCLAAVQARVSFPHLPVQNHGRVLHRHRLAVAPETGKRILARACFV